MPTTDPTVQTKGGLSVGLNLDMNATYIYNGKLRGVPVVAGPIAYGPTNQPPPPWANGTQYYTGNGTAYGSGSMPPDPSYRVQKGILSTLSITDMSSNTVVTGKTYGFTSSLRGNWIQLYTRVTGGPNGSTVLPGFGLWSLGTNPHAWTYVTPEAFTGEWKLGLLSPTCFTPVWLSAEYAPPKDYGAGGLEARLTFTVSGLSLTDYVQKASMQADQIAAPGEQKPVEMQYLHERSDPHVLHVEPDVPVD